MEGSGVLKFIQTGGPYGDATSRYVVELNREFTVEEFINEVLKRDEWGQIRVLNSEIRGKQPFGALVVEYRGDQIIGRGIGYRQYLDQKVRSVRASGGWSAMDYTINLEAGGNIL